MMGRVAGKTAIITGASSGIGRAAARLFAKEGAKLIVAARRKKNLDELVDEIKDTGGMAVAVPGDVTDELYARELVSTAKGIYGGLDIAFNNAGTLGAGGEIESITLDGWNSTLN